MTTGDIPVGEGAAPVPRFVVLPKDPGECREALTREISRFAEGTSGIPARFVRGELEKVEWSTAGRATQDVVTALEEYLAVDREDLRSWSKTTRRFHWEHRLELHEHSDASRMLVLVSRVEYGLPRKVEQYGALIKYEREREEFLLCLPTSDDE